MRELPADPVPSNTRRQVLNASYTRVEPSPVRSPRLHAWSDALGEQLGLARPSGAALEALAGNRVLPGMEPYAARYGGHQFGHWAGQLGDGRAITLGELLAADGTRQELQLKGAGRTPYSRTADGRAVLRCATICGCPRCFRKPHRRWWISPQFASRTPSCASCPATRFL